MWRSVFRHILVLVIQLEWLLHTKIRTENWIWSRVFFKFYIRGSVHLNSGLKKSNEMQQYADIYLPLNYCTCFGRTSSRVHKTAVAASGTDHTIWGASFLKRDQIRWYDLYQRLQLQFYVLLMMGAMDARNM